MNGLGPKLRDAIDIVGVAKMITEFFRSAITRNREKPESTGTALTKIVEVDDTQQQLITLAMVAIIILSVTVLVMASRAQVA